MKRLIILFVLFLLAVILAEAQAPCSYFKNEVDPFDGSTVIVTNPILIHNQGDKISLSFARIDQVRFVMIDLNTSCSACFRTGAKVILLAADGQTLEIETMPASGSIDCGDYLSGGRRLFRLVAEIPEGLLSFVPSAMRLYSTDGYITISEFKGPRIKPPAEIMQSANCLD